MNDLAADGWEYLRADTLPAEQREGLMSKTTVYQNVLVFRRPKAEKPAVKAPVVAAPQPQLTAEEPDEPLLIQKPDPVLAPAAPKLVADNPDK
mgnify:FL=1